MIYFFACFCRLFPCSTIQTLWKHSAWKHPPWRLNFNLLPSLLCSVTLFSSELTGGQFSFVSTIMHYPLRTPLKKKIKRSLDDIYKVSHSSPMGYHWIIFHNYGKREGRWVHSLDWGQRHRQRTQGSFEKNDAAGWVNFMQALQLFLIIFSQQNIFRILSLWQSFVWPLSLSYWLFSTTIPSASMSITDEKIQRKILLTFFGQNLFHVIFDHNLRPPPPPPVDR